MYDKLFLSTVSTDLLIEILEGNTRFPVTAQLLETIVDTYGEAEFVPGLIGIAQGNPFIDAETLEWITRYAESTPTTNGLRTMTLTDHRADYERMLDAPARAMTLTSLQMFVWKHSVRTEYLWSEADQLKLRDFCERASQAAREHQNAIPGGAGADSVRNVEAVSTPKSTLADATMVDALGYVFGE